MEHPQDYELRHDPEIRQALREANPFLHPGARTPMSASATADRAATKAQAKAEKFTRDLEKAETDMEEARQDLGWWKILWSRIRQEDPSTGTATEFLDEVAAANVYRAYSSALSRYERAERELEWLVKGDD